MAKKKCTIYTDGSSLTNPGVGGFGTVIKYNKSKEKIITGGEDHTTNNRMELKAVIEGLKHLTPGYEVEVVSDSQYVVNGMNEWVDNWEKKNFDGVKNPDLWQEYLEVRSKHENIQATWVKGHNGHPENERCDQLAREAAEKIKNNDG